jgi:hypothetical protein
MTAPVCDAGHLVQQGRVPHQRGLLYDGGPPG